MDRGIPGELLPAHGEHVEENLFLTGHLSVDPDGLSFSAQTLNRHPGLSQPQRFDFRSGRKEKGLLCNAEVLSRDTGSIAQVMRRYLNANYFTGLLCLVFLMIGASAL